MGATPQIVVVGGGFAGIWSALSAARLLDARSRSGDVAITLVSAEPYLAIRPRLYERSLDGLRVPLDSLLAPAGVHRVEGRVIDIDQAAQMVTAVAAGVTVRLPFDRLVLAAGSHVQAPPLPGLAEYALTVDSYRDAQRLDAHLRSTLKRTDRPDRFSAVVVGAGFTGIEVATELAGRLAAPGNREDVHVTLVGSSDKLGGDVGPGARSVIDEALRSLNIEVRLGVPAQEIDPHHVTLADGRQLPSATTVWTGGFRASPLTGLFDVTTDELGRLPVDDTLRVEAADHVFAAGDVAHALADIGHPAFMSCQHAIPMGKFAGHNAASDLVGGALLAYHQPDYVTCLDLGAAGAMFTRGWDRAVLFTGPAGKRLKEQINRHDIYPPLSRARNDLLRAAKPEVVSMDGLVALGERIANGLAAA